MITPWKDFMYEQKTTIALASGLKYIGRNGNYELTIYDGGFINLKYSPMEVSLPFSELIESSIERQGGEGGDLYRWIIDKFNECKLRQESNTRD